MISDDSALDVKSNGQVEVVAYAGYDVHVPNFSYASGRQASVTDRSPGLLDVRIGV